MDKVGEEETAGFEIRHKRTGDVLHRVAETSLRGADLSGLALYSANLEGADLREADLRGASLLGAVLVGARLDGAKLHRATLYAADLTRASLRRADLRGTDLRAAIMDTATFAGALLAGSHYGADTRWPPGFDPRAYGAIPARRLTGVRKAERPEPPPDGGPVFVVDDDDGIRRTVVTQLRLAGYEVASAGNGREALEYLRAHPPPAVILLDMSMPEMDGWSFRIEQLKDARLAMIPVIVCSAAYDPAPAAKLVRANGYLVKPFAPELVLETVRRFCRPNASGD